MRIFKEKICKLKRINKVIATIIPPNANEDEIEELKNDSAELQGYEETNITKAKVEYSVSKYSDQGLNMRSKLMQNAIKTVSLGYGDMNVHGVDANDKLSIIRANQDAAFTGLTSDENNNNPSAFKKFAKGLIDRFLTGQRSM